MQNLNEIPPLNGLRAFVATARYGSITKAADHLFVTAGAVSHQLKSLENHIRVKLFHRSNNQLTLTPTGQLYFREIAPAFDAIHLATQNLHKDTNEIKIQVPTSLATRWLIPKLEEFQRLAPHVKINLQTITLSQSLPKSNADITIDFCRDMPSDADILYEDKSVPIIASRNLKALTGTSPASIAKASLIAATEDRWEWSIWAETHNIPEDTLNFTGHFNTDENAILATIAGLGICLMPRILIENELSSGLLKELEQPTKTYGYYTMKLTRSSHRNVKKFASWLREKMRQISET